MITCKSKSFIYWRAKRAANNDFLFFKLCDVCQIAVWIHHPVDLTIGGRIQTYTIQLEHEMLVRYLARLVRLHLFGLHPKSQPSDLQ